MQEANTPLAPTPDALTEPAIPSLRATEAPAEPVAAPASAGAATTRAWPAPLRRLWRSRAALAGLVALALALLGESLMRGTPDNPNPQADWART